MKIKQTFKKFVPYMKWLKKQHHREVEILVILMCTIGKNVEEKKKKTFSLLILSLGMQ